MISGTQQILQDAPASKPSMLRARKAYEVRRNVMSISRYGCSWEKYLTIRGHPATPIRIFKSQRSGARVRGIGWELTIWQWWSAWQQSGHWEQRGHGRFGYCMCRLNDVGPYAVDNIYIATNRENMLDHWVNRRHAASLRLMEAS